jgi:hypothetical protein
LIDEVAIFDRALSVGELSDLFGAALLGGALPPGIATPPASLTLYAGRTATFQVSAVGTSPSYRWRSNGVTIANGGNISGATTDTLVISNVTAANQAAYDVVVSNIVSSVTSAPPATLTVITPVPGSFESAVIAANPLAYYRLNATNDPSSGTVPNLDVWGGFNGLYAGAAQNAFNGILGPQPTIYNFESGNGALQTTSATLNSYATATFGSLSTNTVTMCMWVQPTGPFDNFSGLLMTRTGTQGGFGFGNGGQLGYTWNNNNGNTWGFATGLVPPVGQWSFVALVVEPTQATIYMFNPSGLFAATNVIAHTADVFGNTWQIGHDNSGGDATRTFNGLIDEVAVFNYAMTPAQIVNLYSAGGPPLVTLSIQPSGANVVLTWSQGTLLESPNPTGPWTTNTAASPYTTSPTGSQKFYKVQVR